MASRLDLLAKEHYHAIGNVTVRASQLEWQIEKTVYQGLRAQPETARFLLRNLSADRMRKLMRAVLSDVLPERATEISTLVNDIERVLDERHEIVHWLWGPPDEADIAPHVSARPTREPATPTWGKRASKSDVSRAAPDDLTPVVGMRMCWMVILVRPSPYQLRFRRVRLFPVVGRIKKISVTATIAMARKR